RRSISISKCTAPPRRSRSTSRRRAPRCCPRPRPPLSGRASRSRSKTRSRTTSSTSMRCSPSSSSSAAAKANSRSKLPAELSVDRIGSAAAQRDREAHEAPQQRVFVAAAEPGEAVLPIDVRDDRQLDGGGGREEAGEQPEDERDTAD